MGNLNFDIVFDVDRLPKEHEKLRANKTMMACGGAAANTAYWLAKLGHTVSMVGCIGNDELGICCVNNLTDVGVDVSHIQLSSGLSTGTAVVFANSTSKRMVTSGGANTNLDISCIDMRCFTKGVHLHLAMRGDNRLIPFLKDVKERGASISYDFSGLQSESVASCCDIVFMNLDELRRWTSQWPPKKWWSSFSSAWLVLTKGEEGAEVYCENATYAMSANIVKVIDRTGGGDGFDAGFLSGISRDGDVNIALTHGLRLAAEIVQGYGARPKISSLAIEELSSR